MKPAWEQLDKFTRAYITCALWASNDESDESGGDPLDDNYGYQDINDETVAWMIADCQKFQQENAADIATGHGGVGSEGPFTAVERAGHDFWLTRNGHGCGYWDGDWPEAGDRLTKASKKYGEAYLELDGDGQIYHFVG